MNLDTFAITCGISVICVHAVVEAERPASFLKKKQLILVLSLFVISPSVPSSLLAVHRERIAL